MKRLDVVIPIFDEAEQLLDNLQHIRQTVAGISGVECRILLVDDGSTDGTVELAQRLCADWEGIGLLCLNRNFGKEAAIHAGLEHSTGDGVVVMDSDLQHPPELLPKMVEAWLGGTPLVEACRQSRGYETRTRRWLSLAFYRLFERVSGFALQEHTDFKLLDRTVVDGYLRLPERKRFFRGLLVWMGVPSCRLYFEVPEGRRSSRWSFRRMASLSMEAITSFSIVPLQVVTVLGFVTLIVSLVFGGIALFHKLSGRAMDGFTTVIGLQLLVGSMLMIGLGLIGIYVGRIFEEIKRRPSYLVDSQSSRLPLD